MRLRRAGATTLIAALIGSVLTACGAGSSGSATGEASKDAATILADAIAAVRGASAARMSGDITTSKSHILLTIDIAARDSISGHLTIDGTPVAITTTGGNSYLTGRAFWARVDPTGRAAALLGDRCVLVPPTLRGAASILLEVGQISDLNGLADTLSKPQGSVTKGAMTTAGGLRAVTVMDSASRLFVAADGTPYPLRIEMSGSDRSHLDFSFGKPVTVTAPTGCVDGSTLGGTPGA